MAKKHTAEVSRILVKAREDGDIPWSWIVDETREIEGGGGWDSLEEFGETWSTHYRKNRWVTQGTRVELWSEKGTVRGLLSRIFNRYQLPFRVMHGYSSASEVKVAACQIEETVSSGKGFYALYVGDWDPSGLDMSERDLPNRLERYGYGADFVLDRIALTEDDLAGLPSFPLETKKDDPRHAWYKANYDPDVCWEFDAMSPIALRERVEDEILSYIDDAAWARADMVEQAERESIRQYADMLKTLKH